MQINQQNLITQSDSLYQNQYLRISQFLNSDFADRIYQCLTQEVKWGLACRLDGEAKTFLNTADVNELAENTKVKLQSQLNEEFQFIYNTYMMVTAYLENRDPNLFLNRVLEWLNSVDTVEYFKKLTKNNTIKKLNAQATRYLPGHFLSQHNDENAQEGRLYAYVIGFSKNWNPDWGGLLHILNNKGEIVKTLIPEYNSLSIFKVPQNHFVSYVTPFSDSSRLAITGWLLSK
jgi:Rps23 Pro-64 3,4-dihydroxylase Tpa1-like proline 4-hydroxylase